MMSDNTPKIQKWQRFAIYTRYSTEMQSDLSLEAQEARCREAIAEREGVVVAVYKDSAKSGWSLDRDGFNELRVAAERGKFDAIMFWKFDRLARNHDHAVMIKMLLRQQYSLKLYCVEGVSEDEDDSAYGAFMEQMLAVFSAFYSKNLSSETKRGKRQRAMNGEFNGSSAPVGYDLVTLAQATPQYPAGLYINVRQAALVRRAFRLYASGHYSDADIAHWLNRWRTMRELRGNKKPIDKEMVREMLQNRVYTGRVRYTETFYKGSLGEKTVSRRHRGEWFEGKHEAIIPDDLFELCQNVRANAVIHPRNPSERRVYLVADRVLCARCIARKPAYLIDDNYGRMRPYYHKIHKYAYYRCLAHDRGYEKCGQHAVRVEKIDAQVLDILSHMSIPDGFRDRVESAVQKRVENAASLQRMEELKQIVERIDFSWEQGFLDKDVYLEKRRQLQLEIEGLRRLDYDELVQASDLIEHFKAYWDQCAGTANPPQARKQLIAQIVQKVVVYEDKVLALVLHGDFAVVLEENKIASAEVRNAIQKALEGADVST